MQSEMQHANQHMSFNMCWESQSFPELEAGPSPQLYDGNLEKTLLWCCFASERCLYLLLEAIANYLLIFFFF